MSKQEDSNILIVGNVTLTFIINTILISYYESLANHKESHKQDINEQQLKDEETTENNTNTKQVDLKEETRNLILKEQEYKNMKKRR